MDVRIVRIMRAPQGGGKTYFVNLMTKDRTTDAVVVSADDMATVDGVYSWIPERTGEYHSKCFKMFVEAILAGKLEVYVDNTHIEPWEFSPYVAMAEAYGYKVEIIHALGTYESTHRIHPALLERKRNDFKEIDIPRKFEPYLCRTTDILNPMFTPRFGMYANSDAYKGAGGLPYANVHGKRVCVTFSSYDRAEVIARCKEIRGYFHGRIYEPLAVVFD